MLACHWVAWCHKTSMGHMQLRWASERWTNLLGRQQRFVTRYFRRKLLDLMHLHRNGACARKGNEGTAEVNSEVPNKGFPTYVKLRCFCSAQRCTCFTCCSWKSVPLETGLSMIYQDHGTTCVCDDIVSRRPARLNMRDKWIQWHHARFTCGERPLNEVRT